MPPEDTAAIKRRQRARARFPLVLKIFLLMALVIGGVVAASVLVTIRRADTVAKTTVNKAISGAGPLYADLEQNRLRLLGLGASLVGSDPSFVAYLESAIQLTDEIGAAGGDSYVPPAIDTVSILDLIDSRRGALNSDLVIVTDDQGYQLVRTDEPASSPAEPVDLYDAMPLVRFAIDESPADPAVGLIRTKGRFFHAAVAPIGAGAGGVVQGYMINARAIDQKFADLVAEMTRTSVAFLAVTDEGEIEIPRSTNAPNAESLGGMAEIDEVARTGTMSPPHSATIDGGAFVLTVEPLRAADQVVAVAVFVRSLDAELAPFREIQRTLVVAGLVALAIAFLLSGIVASRVTRPIANLAVVAQAVTDGDLSLKPTVETSDEVGILASSFSKMVAALRDKAELEELYEQMAARSEEAASEPELAKAEARDGTLMVTELRGMVTTTEPDEIVARLDEVVAMQEAEIRRQDGSVVSITGQQVTALFGGDRGVVHAVRSARAIGENLAAIGTELSIGVGIATGDFVFGGVRTSEIVANTLSGDTPFLATIFAREAPGGSMFLSDVSARQAGSDFLAAARPEEVSVRWMPSPLSVAHLPMVGVATGMLRPVTQPGGSDATLKMDGDTVEGAEGLQKDLQQGAMFASRYRIESVLGRGGMGVVYKATDTQLDEVVAIKTLPQRAIMSSPEEVERFKREIRLARKITHRNVLRTFDYGEADGWYFISMEYVRGYTLADLLEQTSTMATRSALGVMRQISRGLEAAHEQSVIHRDIKPQNVLIDHKGEVKLMDFGIARAQEAEAMTQQGVLVGTPHYMSPEQVQGKTLDPRSDIYSMGVLMYEMICGTRPFNSSSLMAVLTAHVTEDPRPPSKVVQDLEPGINEIILRCLAKNPAARYANAGELLDELNHVTVDA